MARRMIKQQEMFELLQNNPLNIAVDIGDLEEMDGSDYICFDKLEDTYIGYDDTGIHQTTIRFTVRCKSYDDRDTTIDFLKENFKGDVSYEHDTEQEYFIGRLTTGVFIIE